ncbi:hypothetical protein FGSG_02288 [Fusarium graminearum PH-1]|uniref:Chromosome 1, complete genome n=1 Tax=Gibberella zeae (strain ATCC MYA-4620 / CBS 123657 / FGSC 9075 / NRRL 31084 / PH-1) TaxID=229533 RepID=I1RF25_GIBZE|nr:hypothetical protein FGSG_02288 [Fusarium graminearum PH-1]ESU07711.1 hypothetical protein FGSG_02288 [Fusarium graminearum PH-1]CEF74565.1 unnamed protein product [Fusarium graminearum]|eukprot:XP_011318196.1 hypothetical protein FGSG_02288 [Fusarium graminearum PH-1]
MVETRRQGSKPNAQARVCPHFLRNKCRYGQNCRLRHDTPSNKSSAPTNHSDTPKPPRDGKLHQWKRLIKLGDMGYNSPELTKAAVGQFFQLGLELLDGDIGAAQDAIKLLAKDSGLAFIKAVVELHIPHTHTLANFTLWESEVKPMFSLITHPRVVDSAVLEQQVADLFNFLLGVQGRRMTKLFNFILQLLVNSLLPAEADSRGNILELSLNVLSKIIDCNTNNIVNPECGRLVSAFVQLMHQHPGSQDDFSFLQASKYIEYMQQRLDTGKDIPDLVYNQTIPVSRQEFVLKRNGPGTLSAEGRRHDNDHANINKIKIMPTYDEIVSPRAEYLPTKYPSQWHIDGIRGRLDREFRLIREDTVGQLRDVVRDMLEAARDPRKGAPQKSKTMRTFNYEDPVTINVDWHRIGGLEMVVRCNQLPVVNKLNAMKRREWWGQSKRLQSGALVCLFDITGTVLFCVVSDTTMRSKDDKDARKMDTKDKEKNQGSDKEVRTLSDDKAVLFVNLKLVDPTTREISQAMRWFKNTRSSPRRYLVEFPGVLLDSFKHTLLALQKMHEKPNVPFKNLLAPSKDSDSDTDVGLPHYARRPGFTFDLSCLSTDNSTLIMDPHSPITPETLALKTSLDPTQSAALLNTLTRELSLVQGPPGTGKSYTGEKIIKVLLNARNKAKLGPILCVCYTNHALDQLLEHLLDDGIKSIIRMGSRSKSERLENLNLRTIAKEAFLTKSEKSGLWEAERGIREDVDEGQKLLQELAFCQSWASVKALMSSEYPRQHMEMFGDDRDGWKTVIHQPEMVIHRWLQGGINTGANPRQLEQLKHVPLQSLSKDERTILHRHWVKSIRDPIITKLARLNKQYNDDVTRKDEIRGDIDLRCLNEANIVGVTTTGLARNLNLLRKLRCKVLLCEEAGEVLEAHNLTALLPSIEHTILIGDHLQLRPQIQNYDLQSTNPRGKQFSLDVSLFERLVEPSHDTAVKIPYSVLETQRRMHPSIAELVRSTLYPSLKDSENVEEYPQVVGMRRRLFWFDHDHPETANDNNESTSTSKSNNFEVDMTASLVSHLSQQGKYGAGDIAVLTPYLGQLQLLRRRMESMFEICVNDRDADDLEAIEEEGTDTKTPNAGTLRKTTLLKTVRVATVDNFQGEEAKIIVISLVRSNPQQECGFLKTSNRINVLLSRAQHGMYIIGNQNSYERVPMWAGVIKILAAGENIGTKLELQCPRHPETPALVSHPEHFSQMSPEDAETLARINVSSDLRVLYCFRADINCFLPNAGKRKIQRLFAASRWLPRRYLDVAMKYTSNAARMLQRMPLYASQPAGVIAPVDIPARRVAPNAIHEKTGCAQACHGDAPCQPCKERCEARCTHSRCDKTCSEPCAPCAEATCASNCAHSQCTAPCAAPCNWVPCSLRCDKLLDCGHQCPSLCGEVCPTSALCQVCATDEIKSVCVDFIMMAEYRDIDLNEEPCIFPSCGHFLTVSSMDGQMGMAAHYTLDANGLPTQILRASEPFSLDGQGIKSCPTCRGSLRSVSRYGRIVRRAMLDEATKKFISWSNDEYHLVASRLVTEQECLAALEPPVILDRNAGAAANLTVAGSRQRQLQLLKEFVGTRYGSIIQCRKTVVSYATKVKKEEQPFQRVANLVKHSNLHRGGQSEFQYDQAVIQSKGGLLASALLLKCDILILSDLFGLLLGGKARFSASDVNIDFSRFMIDCDALIKDAKTALYPREEAQGHLFYAQLCVLSRQCASAKAKLTQTNATTSVSESTAVSESLEQLHDTGLGHIFEARRLLEENPSILVLKNELDAAEEALNGGVYRPVTAEELRQVYAASKGELRGTGHWYTCRNGHPFTINNCGMAMEQATCPECRAPIGGQNHRSVEGVRHATEIEQMAEGLRGMRL